MGMQGRGMYVGRVVTLVTITITISLLVLVD